MLLGSAERRKIRLISREIFSKYSNLCDHDTTLQGTDRQTDRQRYTDRQLAVAIPRFA